MLILSLEKMYEMVEKYVLWDVQLLYKKMS